MDEQAYFWSERWQQGEREAEADIQAGRLHRFENLDDAFAFLDEEENNKNQRISKLANKGSNDQIREFQENNCPPVIPRSSE